MRIICRCILHNYFITGVYTDVSRYVSWVAANADYSGSTTVTTTTHSTTPIKNTDFICRADGNNLLHLFQWHSIQLRSKSITIS